MAKREWTKEDEAAEIEGKAIRDMNKNFGGLRPNADNSRGGRHTSRSRNRRCAVATAKRVADFAEIGVIF